MCPILDKYLLGVPFFFRLLKKKNKKICIKLHKTTQNCTKLHKTAQNCTRQILILTLSYSLKLKFDRDQMKKKFKKFNNVQGGTK
jgi:hypothetical protein